MNKNNIRIRIACRVISLGSRLLPSDWRNKDSIGNLIQTGVIKIGATGTRNDIKMLFISLVFCGMAGFLLALSEHIDLFLVEIMGWLMIWMAGFVCSQSRLNELHQQIVDLKIDLLHK